MGRCQEVSRSPPGAHRPAIARPQARRPKRLMGHHAESGLSCALPRWLSVLSVARVGFSPRGHCPPSPQSQPASRVGWSAAGTCWPVPAPPLGSLSLGPPTPPSSPPPAQLSIVLGIKPSSSTRTFLHSHRGPGLRFPIRGLLACPVVCMKPCPIPPSSALTLHLSVPSPGSF